MSSFTDELTLTHVDMNWRLWRLERDFTYEVGEKGSGRAITVPKGFLTDGASVPRLLWSIFPAWGSYSRAAFIHDYLCYRLNKGDPHPEGETRKQVDGVFREAMKVCGTGLIARTALYVGVRIGAINFLWSRPSLVSRVQ